MHSAAFRVGVTGGRCYADSAFVFKVLDRLHSRTPFGLLIEGGAAGLDTLAWRWACSRGVPHLSCFAAWWLYGDEAGRLRNIDMAIEERIDLLIAFEGDWGTRHMMAAAHQAGIKIFDAVLDPLPRKDVVPTRFRPVQ